MKLRRYWFKFNLTMRDPHPAGTLLGCGATARSKEEALELVRERVFGSHPMPSVAKCIEDVNLADLDPKHVLPNIGEQNTRGVWFPMGADGDR